MSADYSNALPVGELERVHEGEIVESPWQSTEAGCPVFVSKSYDEHEGEWISKEQEGNAILWEMAAIGYSLVGLAARERDAQGQVKRFAGVVKTTARRVQQLAQSFALRTKLEVEERSRFRPLADGLTMAHYNTVAEQVFNRAETNALECGEWLEKADDEGWTAAELKRRIEAAADGGNLDLAVKPAVLYADPPWEYSNDGFDSSAASQYATMSTERLCGTFAEWVRDNLPDDAVLFMWATNPLLPDALRVVEAWGFEYKTNLTWVKRGGTGGTGFYVRGLHELLLLCTRGRAVPPPELRPASVIEAPATRHSAKPHSVYEVIEGMYPHGPYVEFFARNTRGGWGSWGNEVPGE